MTTVPVCVDVTCPVCDTDVIPGLDACFCRNCHSYYPTQTGIKMEANRLKKIAERKEQARLARLAAKGGDAMPLFQFDRDSVGYSHHDFEDMY